MTSLRLFFSQTAETASFAFREYFRPVYVVARFIQSSQFLSDIGEVANEDQCSLEDAKMVLRKSLANSRRHERLLLTQCIVSALASVLAAAISLLHVLEPINAAVLVIVLLLSFFAVWVAFRIIKNRESIIEQKTLYRILKSVDADTARCLVNQITWPKPKSKPRKKSRTDKNPL